MSIPEKKVILLVEDEALIEVVEKEILNHLGYEVITTNSGEMAVETVLNDNNKIDLILMDINLGQGIDGPETAERILKEKDIPIVFIATHSEKEYVEKLKRISCYGCVFKPSGEFVLNSSIEIALEQFQARKNLQKKMERLHQMMKIYQETENETFLNENEIGSECFEAINYNH
ncbi:MAG: response regulator [Deltaproteobacteria bacterium]|nr:response regulator [Deltaproteobacteria bacterium]